MPRHGFEDAIGWIDPRSSREAAWRALELAEIFGDPAFGGGPDEIEFPRGVNRTERAFFHS
jgi:hypothetical protein